MVPLRVMIMSAAIVIVGMTSRTGTTDGGPSKHHGTTDRSRGRSWFAAVWGQEISGSRARTEQGGELP
jgi:hypothetical protein